MDRVPVSVSMQTACILLLIVGLNGCISTADVKELTGGGAELGDPGNWPDEPVTFRERSHLTDAKLSALSESLHRLRPTSFELRDVPVTDASIPVIQGLASIRQLAVVNTKMTPSGVLTLARQLPRLTDLMVGGDAFDEAVADLRAELPGKTVTLVRQGARR